MRYCYNRLWKLLIDKNLKKTDLKKIASISSSTLAKMSKELPVSIEILGRLCKILSVKIEDILEIIY